MPWPSVKGRRYDTFSVDKTRRAMQPSAPVVAAAEVRTRKRQPMKAGIAIVVIALGAVIVEPLRLEALGPDPNLKARSYSTALVQAMDQCTSVITNVGGVGACAPSNSSTDGTPFTSGKVSIRNRSTSSQVRMSLKS